MPLTRRMRNVARWSLQSKGAATDPRRKLSSQVRVTLQKMAWLARMNKSTLTRAQDLQSNNSWINTLSIQIRTRKCYPLRSITNALSTRIRHSQLLLGAKLFRRINSRKHKPAKMLSLGMCRGPRQESSASVHHPIMPQIKDKSI